MLNLNKLIPIDSVALNIFTQLMEVVLSELLVHGVDHLRCPFVALDQQFHRLNKVLVILAHHFLELGHLVLKVL